MKEYLVITDYISNGKNIDVSDDIQRVIDENPNRVIFFPDGEYTLSKPILTSSHPKNSVCLLLSAYAKIRPSKSWNSDEALIRLGAKDNANIIDEAGSNYYLDGGIIDGEGIANGISIDGGRETVIKNCSIKNTPIGITIKHGANNGSSDADITGVNIVGTSKSGCTGVLVNGWDNTFTNMRIGRVQIGFMINTSGNIFRNIHPLLYGSKEENFYKNSRAFCDMGGSNFYDNCYSDQFYYGFEIGENQCNLYSNCFCFWYSPADGFYGGIKANGKFNSIINGLRFSFGDPATEMSVLTVDENGGDGKLENLLIAQEDKITDKTYLTYKK